MEDPLFRIRHALNYPKAPCRKPKRSVQRKYYRKRRKNDPYFRLTSSLRTRISEALRKQGTRKTERSLHITGCELDQLLAHLSDRFLPGMTWDNYGKWHVDHIKPCCEFDLTDLEQKRQCFHYTNLQPLWAADNIRKGGFYSSPIVSC